VKEYITQNVKYNMYNLNMIIDVIENNKNVILKKLIKETKREK